MAIDVRTLYLAVAVVCLANIMAISAMWLLNRRVPGMRPWTLGVLFTGLSFPLFLFQGISDARILTHVLSNGLYFAAVLSFMAGALEFRGKPVRWRPMLLLWLIPMVSLCWFLFIVDRQSIRVVIFSGAAACFYLVTTCLMATERRFGLRFSSWLVAAAFGIFGGGMLFRCVWWWIFHPGEWISGNATDNAILALVALVASSILIFSILLLVNQHHVRESAHRLMEQHAMEKRIKEAELAAERHRASRSRMIVARELHDGIGGITAALATMAGIGRRGSKDDMAEILTEFEKIAYMGSREIRGLMGSVEDDVFRWSDWLEELESYARRVTALADISLAWRTEGVAPEGFIRNTDAASSLMKVVLETIHNLVRHSAASKCVIEVKFRETAMEMNIRDDGCGFGGETDQGRGISNMRTRMEEMGGTFSIDGNGGTTVMLWCPLDRRADTGEDVQSPQGRSTGHPEKAK